ncbi:MAG: glycosyltransferase family 4 protein [Candidatus Glassbacteria bacterium]
MNILISSASLHFSDFIGAGETQIAYGYASSLARMGHRVTVLSPRVSLSKQVEGLRAIELCPRCLSSSDGGHASKKLLWWRFSLMALKEAKKILKREGIDIIHHMKPAYEGKFSLLTRLGPPFVYGPMSLTWRCCEDRGSEPAGIDFPALLKAKLADRLDMHLGKRLYSRTLSEARTILLSSEKLKGHLPESLLRKAVRLQYGVDTDVFHPNGYCQSGLPVILFLGLLTARKGIYDLLHAFSILRGRVDARLRLVGEGDTDGVRALAARLGIDDRTEILGKLPHTDVAKQFRSCALFCLPSHGEPFGMVLLEAMASGKPVVATVGGGVDEIVDDGVSGILVDQENPAQLAGAMERLLVDRVYRERLGAAAREKAVSVFDWMLMAQKLVSVYEEVIGG